MSVLMWRVTKNRRVHEEQAKANIIKYLIRNSVIWCLRRRNSGSGKLIKAIYSYLDSTCGSSSGGVNSISTGGINGFNGVSLTNSAAFASYTSAHPNGPSSGDWASFTSANGISSGPWGTGVPTGWSTQYGSGGPGGFGGGGGPGGQHGPFGFGGGPGGWGPNSGGPFQGGNWGNGPFGQSGAWTTGAWTKWWNGNQCPASDWPGWTSGSWSTSAPWTSWSACTASVTSSSIYTTTSFGSNVPYTTTSFGYMVAQATAAGQSAALTTGSSGATSITVAGGAAAAALMGFIAMLKQEASVNMCNNGSSASSNHSEARQRAGRPYRSRHRWWTAQETGEEIHEVDFGYEHFLQLDDRGNLVGICSRSEISLLHPTYAGFTVPLDSYSPPVPYSDIASVDRTEYEELNQAVRERVYEEGWSQQGALLPGQEALRRGDMRDTADHIDNQPREPQGPPRICTNVIDLLDLKDVEAYVDEDGAVEVEKLDLHLRTAERCIDRRLYQYIELSTTSCFARYSRYESTALEAVVQLRNNLPHSFDSAAQFSRAILKVRTSLAALRLSIGWYYQQNPEHRDEMCDWPRSWKNLLKILCEILPSLWKGVEGHQSGDDAARRANATLLVMKTIGQHIDQAPSFLTMYTLRELGMIMLDGKPTNALRYQNWSFEPGVTSDKAWEEMRMYLTGHRYHDVEQDLISSLNSRGTRLYKGMTDLCKALLCEAKKMRELDVVKTGVSPQTYGTHKRALETLAKSFDEIRHKIDTQTMIIKNVFADPGNKDWLRKRHALYILKKIDELLALKRRQGDTICDSRLAMAYQDLEKLVYRGEEMTLYEAHRWYADPTSTDGETAWNEFMGALDLDSWRLRKRELEFIRDNIGNNWSLQRRLIEDRPGEEDDRQWFEEQSGEEDNG
ncbi:hypothetical protein FKW77_001263 [Venturia effusa]|uniref:Uncharacterized protein n=1 Tax=Venturia effusa TaxID=50376 RepID=A0A517L8M7_9PEZI|nr:hypothetical protein FKW77_001263 [Venturia effusa]